MKKPSKKAPPLTRWERQLQSDMAFAARTIIADGTLYPLFILHNRDGSFTPFRSALRDAEHKHRVYQFFGLLLVATDAAGISVMCESWVRSEQLQPGETSTALLRRVERDGPMPRQASDRQEVLTVSLAYRDDADERQVKTTIGDIIRGDDGGVVAIKWWKDGETLDGAVRNIMPPNPPRPEHTAIAAHAVKDMGPAIMKALDIVEVTPPT
jgi:hypothetical protein